MRKKRKRGKELNLATENRSQMGNWLSGFQERMPQMRIPLLISLFADLILISLDFLNKLTEALNSLNTKGWNFFNNSFMGQIYFFKCKREV